MSTIISREEWGARAPRYTTEITAPVGVCIHYWGSPTSGTPEAVRSAQNKHMDENGWADFAYNEASDADATVYEGRGFYNRSAANGNTQLNSMYLAFAYMVGPGEKLSEKAIQAARDFISEARRIHPTCLEIIAHRDVTSTSCPGDDIYALVEAGVFEPGYNATTIVEPTPVDIVVEPASHIAVPGLLQVGDYGPAVQLLQAELQNYGFDIGRHGADGIYGFDTADAVKQFQIAAQFATKDIDGVFGPQTLVALAGWGSLRKNNVPAFPGIQSEKKHTPEGALAVQKAINAIAGYELLREDGDYGSKTGDQVQNIQRFFNLIPDRVVGTITWPVLHGYFGYEVH